MGFLKIFGFPSSLMGQEGHTSQHPNVLVGFRRPNIGREDFLAFCTKSEDIPYHGDFCETVDRFMLNMFRLRARFSVQNRCHLCPKSGLNLAKKWLFTSFIQDINVILIVGLQLFITGTNVTTLLWGRN